MPSKKTIKPETKPKADAADKKHQHFDGEKVRQDAMAMFSGGLNTYKRGTDNKWHKTRKP